MLVGVVLTVLTACISFYVISSSVGRKSKGWRLVLFRSGFRSHIFQRDNIQFLDQVRVPAELQIILESYWSYVGQVMGQWQQDFEDTSFLLSGHQYRPRCMVQLGSAMRVWRRVFFWEDDLCHATCLCDRAKRCQAAFKSLMRTAQVTWRQGCHVTCKCLRPGCSYSILICTPSPRLGAERSRQSPWCLWRWKTSWRNGVCVWKGQTSWKGTWEFFGASRSSVKA